MFVLILKKMKSPNLAEYFCFFDRISTKSVSIESRWYLFRFLSQRKYYKLPILCTVAAVFAKKCLLGENVGCNIYKSGI